jgi:transcriptional regulator with XRE-family HTH domain
MLGSQSSHVKRRAGLQTIAVCKLSLVPDDPTRRVVRVHRPSAEPAGESLPELRRTLGGRVRAARTQRGLSTRALAAATSLSPGFVSQLENGHVMPSVGTLVAIATALEIRVADLFATAPVAHGVLRRAERVAYEANPGVRDEVISLDPSERLEVVIGTIAPGASSGDELYSHGADTEFVLVQRGTIDILLGDETVTLAEGDAVTFAGDVPHGYVNRSDEPVEVVWVMTPATY